jgi:hypothetical protein
MDGPVHRGEIHAVAITDRTMQTPDIGLDKLRLLEQGYQNVMMVDEAITHVGDWLLTAEVVKWWGLQRRFKSAQESIHQIEDHMFAIVVDQRVCRCQLEEAWAVD